MENKTYKLLIIALYMLLLLSLLLGCSSDNKTKTGKSNSSKTSTESNTLNNESKVNVTVGDNSDTLNGNTPAKPTTPNTTPTVNPNASGAKNAVSSITSTPSTAKPKSIPAVNVTNIDSFKSAVIVNLSQGKDIAINLHELYTKDNIADKVMKVIETSGYAGYVSGIQYSIVNNVAYIYFQYKGGSASFLTKSSAVDTTVSSIVNKTITDNMSDYDKELALHDYLVNNVAYDYANLVKNTIPEDSYTAYGALVKGVAVCEGYAEAMHKLLTLAGVDNYIINGFGDGVAHQWNLVNIQGGIYHLDATFDDPISTSGQVITHNYFNVNDVQISKNHTWNSADYPKSTAVVANYYTFNKLLASNKSKYYEIIKNQLIKKNPVISIKTSSYDPKTYTSDALLKVLKDNKGIDYVDMTSGYSFSYDPDSSVIEIGVNYK
ncbi:MAG: hypothetical protein H7Y18_18700 [Clostridiaceae bacterium]|nr:hypothetical protein [Clostridiaceae bacterium]